MVLVHKILVIGGYFQKNISLEEFHLYGNPKMTELESGDGVDVCGRFIK